MEDLISITEASTMTGLPEKRLLGLAIRNDWHDPMIVELGEDGKAVMLDDWRLERLQTSTLGDRS